MQLLNGKSFIQFSLILLSAGLVSCGSFGGGADGRDEKPVDEGIPISGSLADLEGVTPLVNAGQLPSEDEIEWADEDPNAPMSLDEVWSKKPQDEWNVSYFKAVKQARRQGRPLLIWFTHSSSSPMCKKLSMEVFSAKGFRDWASENVIRLRVDSLVNDEDVALRTRKREYIQKLKRRYKVVGAPVVLLVSPRGTVAAKYVGYHSGNGEFYFGRLKSGYKVALKDYANWREEMESKGYRMWHDRRGRTLFAKLNRYKVTHIELKEPDGSKSTLAIKKLSAEDQQWIEREKRKHEQ